MSKEAMTDKPQGNEARIPKILFNRTWTIEKLNSGYILSWDGGFPLGIMRSAISNSDELLTALKQCAEKQLEDFKSVRDKSDSPINFKLEIFR